MNRRSISIVLFALVVSAGVQADVINGQLGDVRQYRMQQGALYEYEVRSYQFTPGINFVSPSGQPSHSSEEAVRRPWHDGRGIVHSTATRFRATETGTYQLQVFSWDAQGPRLFYSMSDSLIGADTPEPPPPAPPAPSPNCPAHSCFDPTVGSCVPDNVPNYCGFMR